MHKNGKSNTKKEPRRTEETPKNALVWCFFCIFVFLHFSRKLWFLFLLIFEKIQIFRFLLNCFMICVIFRFCYLLLFSCTFHIFLRISQLLLIFHIFPLIVLKYCTCFNCSYMFSRSFAFLCAFQSFWFLCNFCLTFLVFCITLLQSCFFFKVV